MHESGFINSSLLKYGQNKSCFLTLKRRGPGLATMGMLIYFSTDAHAIRAMFFLDEGTRHGIVLHLLPAYSSDQTQSLDVEIFGLQKSEAKRLRLPQNLNSQTVQVVKMLAGLQKATTRHNVVRAFRCAAICRTWSEPHQALLVHVDRSAASHIRHWNCSKKRAVILGEPAEFAYDPIEELDDPFRDEAQ
jgi:hypothetical protein